MAAGISVVIAAIGSILVFNFSTFSNSVDLPCKLTPSNTQGPYYKAGAPFSTTLGEGLEGERFIVNGRVLNQSCEPIPAATLDFWQTDSNGNYDSQGFTLRGKLQTSESGEYTLNTIFPGKYSELGFMRPRHIHVKVSAPNQPTLTTQLYFEDDPHRDLLVKDELIMKITKVNGVKVSSFDFVIKT